MTLVEKNHCYNKCRSSQLHKNNRDIFIIKDKDLQSSEHIKWRCQYHIVFAPKYRRMEIYGELKKDIGWILRKLSEDKDAEIIEEETCPDHIHLLLSIPPKYSISSFMGYLKGKSSLMIFDRHANLKHKYGSRTFWARGYFVDTVGRNKKQIENYIRNHLEQDQIFALQSTNEWRWHFFRTGCNYFAQINGNEM